jgi:hypothetical protein
MCDLPADQIGCKRRKSVVATLGPAIFDRDVLALDIALLCQPFTECSNQGCRVLGRPAPEKPDDRRHRLLRMRREEPCGCPASSKRDELPPSHPITSDAYVAPATRRQHNLMISFRTLTEFAPRRAIGGLRSGSAVNLSANTQAIA